MSEEIYFAIRTQNSVYLIKLIGKEAFIWFGYKFRRLVYLQTDPRAGELVDRPTGKLIKSRVDEAVKHDYLYEAKNVKTIHMLSLGPIFWKLDDSPGFDIEKDRVMMTSSTKELIRFKEY